MRGVESSQKYTDTTTCVISVKFCSTKKTRENL